MLLSAVGVGGVLGALAVPRVTRRFGTGRGLVLTQVCTAPLVVLLPLTPPGPGVGLFVLGSLAVGIGLVAGNVVTAGWRLTYCPPDMLGRVTAAVLTLVSGAVPLGALAGGAVAALFGVRVALAAGGVVLVLAVLGLVTGPVRAVRDLPRRDPESAVPAGR